MAPIGRVSTPPEVMVETFCSIVGDLTTVDAVKSADGPELVFAQHMTQWLDGSGVPTVALEGHKREIALLLRRSEVEVSRHGDFFRRAAADLDWIDAQTERIGGK